MEIPHTLDSIMNADRSALCQYWHDAFDSAPPAKLSQPLMRMILSDNLQAQQMGELDRASKRALKRLQQQIEITGKRPTKKRSKDLAVGARLLREWNGKTHVVERTTTGYLWNEVTYRSLSAVAEAITGAHWSGPRFFGLQRQKP